MNTYEVGWRTQHLHMTVQPNHKNWILSHYTTSEQLYSLSQLSPLKEKKNTWMLQKSLKHFVCCLKVKGKLTEYTRRKFIQF